MSITHCRPFGLKFDSLSPVLVLDAPTGEGANAAALGDAPILPEAGAI